MWNEEVRYFHLNAVAVVAVAVVVLNDQNIPGSFLLLMIKQFAFGIGSLVLVSKL